MDLSNVKLVVSDMDGTLLNNNHEVSKQFFELFEKLHKKNIHFVSASGRQYSSIVSKLDSIKNKIYVVAENGGLVKYQDEVLLINTIKPEKLAALIPLIREIENTNIILCGKDSAYVESKDEQFIATFQEYYENHKQVDDLMKVIHKTDFLKIAIYHNESSEKFIYPKVKHLEDAFLIKISGQNWLDISDAKSNKGVGVALLQKKLNITKDETLVFGDFHNDIEMMQKAKFSVAMENAHEDLKKIANFTTASNTDFGVEKVLEKLLSFKS